MQSYMLHLILVLIGIGLSLSNCIAGQNVIFLVSMPSQEAGCKVATNIDPLVATKIDPPIVSF